MSARAVNNGQSSKCNKLRVHEFHALYDYLYLNTLCQKYTDLTFEDLMSHCTCVQQTKP